MDMLRKRQNWEKLVQTERAAQERIAVLSTFTANPLVPYLGLALEEAGLPAEVWIGPYNQMIQQCLDDTSETARFKPTLLIVWPRFEELWGGRPLPLIEPIDQFVNEAIELSNLFLDAASRWQAILVFVLPAIPETRPLGIGDACSATGVFATATAVREALRRRLVEEHTVLLLDMEEVIRSLGSAAVYDYRLLALAHIPFSEKLFHLVSERLSRLILLSRRPARKVVVLDGDNTLWGGIIGEDGVSGIDLDANGPGAAYGEFQTFLLELRRAGMLLTLCSKNEEADVWKVFTRPEMRLKPETLTAWRIGWQPKHTYIQELAEELQLGTESFVFIDDNAAEIAEVRTALPDVACIQMPADAVDWLEALQGTGVLDRLPPTFEDLQRTSYYQQERLRSTFNKKATSPQAYLAQLKIKILLFSPTAVDISRLTQLVAKTNQFNLNCRRRSAQDITQLCADQHYVVRLAHARDRFGDYGIIGACIVRLTAEGGELDTFVMSCRTMGRSIEEVMLFDLFETIAERGGSKLSATVEECPRNEPARTFFARFGCDTAGVSYNLHRPQPASYITTVRR